MVPSTRESANCPQDGISIGSSVFAGLADMSNITERATRVAIGRIYVMHEMRLKDTSCTILV